MEEKIELKYGYLAPIRKSEDLIFGADNFHDPVLMPGGHGWGAYLPAEEIQQNNYFDTYGCTVFGTLNILETIAKHKYGNVENFSDRYTAIGAGIVWRTGGNPVTVIDTIRKRDGVIPESALPFDSSITTPDAFFSPKPLPDNLLEVGQRWLNIHEVKYEFVPNDIESIKDALQYSPLGVAVYAWKKNGDLFVRPPGAPDIHWTMLYDFEDGKYWCVYDSYDQSHKKLAWDFGFNTVLRYAILDKKPDKEPWYSQLFKSFRLSCELTKRPLVKWNRLPNTQTGIK